MSYIQISSSDPIISLLLANVLPDVKVQDFDITNAQAYQNGEEIVPAGEITFTMTVEPETNVTLYRLNEDGELVSETLEVTDGTVSYQSTGCGATDSGYVIRAGDRSNVRIGDRSKLRGGTL